MIYWLFETLFPESRFSNHPHSVTSQKYQSPFNQSFKNNSVHMWSLILTPTLSFEPRSRMFITTQNGNACSSWTPCLKMTDQIKKFLFKCRILHSKGPRCLLSFNYWRCFLFYALRLSQEMLYLTFYLTVNFSESSQGKVFSKIVLL